MPWPDGAFDPVAFSAMAPVVQERVAVLGEVPAMVDFLFLDTPVFDPDSWPSPWPATTAHRSSWRRPRRLRGAPWTTGQRPPSMPPPSGVAESVGRKLGKAQAPIRIAVTGRRVGPPLFEALEVLGPDRTLGRLAGRPPHCWPPAQPPRHDRTARSHDRPGSLIPVGAGDPLFAVRMLRLLLRLVKYVLIAVVVYLGGDGVAGVAHGPAVRTPGRRGHRGDGGGPVQRGAVARSAGPARAGRAPVAPALLVHHHGHRVEGAGRPVTPRRRPRPSTSGRWGCRPPTSCRPGGRNSWQNLPRTPPSCSSPGVTPTC